MKRLTEEGSIPAYHGTRCDSSLNSRRPLAPTAGCGSTEVNRMSRLQGRLLFWSPRILSIAFACFISMFALDVFGDHLGFWRTILALALHLIPTFIMAAAIVIAWRWEWVGAAIFGALAALYIVITLPRHHLDWILFIAGPALLVAALYLVDWIKRKDVRAAFY